MFALIGVAAGVGGAACSRLLNRNKPNEAAELASLRKREEELARQLQVGPRRLPPS